MVSGELTKDLDKTQNAALSRLCETLPTDASPNGPYSRGEAIFPEQLWVLSGGIESEEIAFDFAIFRELDLPHLIGQKL